MPFRSESRRLYVLLIVVLALLSAAYIRHGMKELVDPNSGAHGKDLWVNWLEFRTFCQHGNVYVYPQVIGRSSPYPPYAFLINGLFYWPGWPAVKLYFAGVSLLCVVLCAWWASKSDANVTNLQRWFLAFAVLGCSVISNILEIGQNTTIYVAAVVGCLVFLQTDWQILAGIALAIACSKINIALSFFIPLIVCRKFKALAAAVVYFFVATALVCWWIRVGPLQIIRPWRLLAQQNLGEGYDFGYLLSPLGLDIQSRAILSAVIVLGAALTVGYLNRRSSWTAQFAIASVAGRLWTYHRIYDNFMLIFLVVALLLLCFAKRRAVLLAVTVGVCGIFWAPPSMINHKPLWVLAMALWIAGAGLVWKYGSERRSSSENPIQNPSALPASQII